MTTRAPSDVDAIDVPVGSRVDGVMKLNAFDDDRAVELITATI